MKNTELYHLLMSEIIPERYAELRSLQAKDNFPEVTYSIVSGEISAYKRVARLLSGMERPKSV